MTSTFVPNDLERVENCVACGSPHTRLFHSGVNDCLGLTSGCEWHFLSCRECDHVFLGLRPKKEYVHRAYCGYYTQHSMAVHSIGGVDGYVLSLKQRVIDAYVSHTYSHHIRASFSGWLVSRLLCLMPMKKLKIDVDHRFLPKPHVGSRLLDVGCGNGFFLRKAAQCGWEAEGIDFDQRAVSVAAGHGLRSSTTQLHELLEDGRRYDVITMSHVIEHLYNPSEVLQQVYNALAPSGILYLDTPNRDSLQLRLFGKHWRGLEAPRHISIFSKFSLEKLLKQAGFDEIRYLRRTDVMRGMYKASLHGVGQDRSLGLRLLLITVISFLPFLLPTYRLEFLTIIATKKQ